MSNPDIQPLSGVLAPALTPFNDDLSVAEDLYLAHARKLMADGCGGLAPFGTTSEANSLSRAERMHLLELLIDGGISPDALMPGTGLCSFPETVELTRHAVDLGCAGVLMLPPFYYKGVSDDGLFDYVARVIEEVASDKLRIYCYHFPAMAVIGYSTALLKRLSDAFPGTIVGTKDSTGDWTNSQATHSAIPGFGVFVGSELLLWDNLKAGGPGCITATANINSAGISALYRGWQDEDAASLNDDVCTFRKIMQAHPVIPAMKWLIAETTGEARWRNVRPPLRRFDDSAGRALLAELCDNTSYGTG